MQEDMFLRMGQRIKEAREECGLTQQELAEQTGRGLRHLQDIEKGRKNPSFDILTSYINRLGSAPNELFYTDVPAVEKEVQHLMGNLLACTEDERAILLKTLDCMADQFISRHYKTSNPQEFK